MSPMHNHKGSHCFVRVLEGEATEIKFERSKAGVVAPNSVQVCPEGSLASSYDDEIHSIANFQETDLVTIHCYSPPLLRPEVFSVQESFVPKLQASYGRSLDGLVCRWL